MKHFEPGADQRENAQQRIFAAAIWSSCNLSTMICAICQTPAEHFEEALVLDKYQVQYFRCPKCGDFERLSGTSLNGGK